MVPTHSRSAEAAARLRTCKALLKMAWLSLWYDSTAFSATVFNIVRSEGDDIIASVRKQNGETVNLAEGHRSND